MNLLDALKQHTVVVADTGDLDAIRAHRPQDATTNPSLILKAAQQENTKHLVDAALAEAARVAGDDAQRAEAFLDDLFVRVGKEILELIPGRVSTEVDARLSFDTEATVQKARQLIARYESQGIERDRILIKIASTWEGITAARTLEGEGIRCNMTLLFSFAQAIACANAGVQLISPFVGRIYDYWRAKRGVDDLPITEDPGVESVRRIYEHYKKFDISTEVMGASFRKVDQIVELCGCDLLTIAPDLLESMQNTRGGRTRPSDRRGGEAERRRTTRPGGTRLPLAPQPGRDGRGEAGRRHSPFRPGRAQARGLRARADPDGLTLRRWSSKKADTRVSMALASSESAPRRPERPGSTQP